MKNYRNTYFAKTVHIFVLSKVHHVRTHGSKITEGNFIVFLQEQERMKYVARNAWDFKTGEEKADGESTGHH